MVCVISRHNLVMQQSAEQNFCSVSGDSEKGKKQDIHKVIKSLAACESKMLKLLVHSVEPLN